MSRIIDFDPEFTWNEGEVFPVALVERGRDHARHCYEREFAGVVVGRVCDRTGVEFVVMTCACCGMEIGRGIVWLTPPSNGAYPWQPGYGRRKSRAAITTSS
jgi:hypothetical protein